MTNPLEYHLEGTPGVVLEWKWRLVTDVTVLDFLGDLLWLAHFAPIAVTARQISPSRIPMNSSAVERQPL